MAKFRQHIVAYGDTIQSIAQKHLGDMSRWVEIARFNNLKHPYIVDTVREKMENKEHLVTVGDILVIKMTESTQDELISELKHATEYDQEEMYALALGKDLDIMPIRDVYGNTLPDTENLELKGDPRGHVKTVKGIDNLKQALYIRLATPKGSYVGHPDFGSEIHKYLGGKNNEETATLLDLEIERTLRTDKRVSGVNLNNHSIKGNTYTASFTVYTLNREEAFEFVISAQEDGPVVLLDSFTHVPY